MDSFKLTLFLAMVCATRGQDHHHHMRDQGHRNHRYTPSYMKPPRAEMYPRGYEFAIKGFDLDPPDAPRDTKSDPDFLFRRMFSSMASDSKHHQQEENDRHHEPSGDDNGDDKNCRCHENVCHCHHTHVYHDDDTPHGRHGDDNGQQHHQNGAYRQNYRQGRLPQRNNFNSRRYGYQGNEYDNRINQEHDRYDFGLRSSYHQNHHYTRLPQQRNSHHSNWHPVRVYQDRNRNQKVNNFGREFGPWLLSQGQNWGQGHFKTQGEGNDSKKYDAMRRYLNTNSHSFTEHGNDKYGRQSKGQNQFHHNQRRHNARSSDHGYGQRW